MATIRKRGKRWRAEVCVKGQRDSDTFVNRAQAAAWALQREAELSGARLPDKSVRDALEHYRDHISPSKRGHQWERVRLNAFARHPLASRRLAGIGRADLEAWRDERLAAVSGASVRRELNLWQSVLKAAVEWHWLRESPAKGIKRPRGNKPRDRRISDDEATRITLALGYVGGVPATLSQRIALAFLFAIETGMRSGEICALRWRHVHAADLYVHIPESKNGDARDVPLSERAAQIIELMPRDGDKVFAMDDAQRDALFRKARDAAQIQNLHFHDTRHEAITRLARKLDILDLARMIGHRDLDSLQIYYNPTASEIARRLRSKVQGDSF